MAEKVDQMDPNEKIVEIAIERLRVFENHPFRVEMDSQMKDLQDSIKQYGIITPVIVRPRKEGYYEIMAIPAMRMLPISLVLLTMEMQIQRIRIHQRILEILTNQTTQMALAALIQRIHRHVPTYPLLLVRLLARWRMPFCRINS